MAKENLCRQYGSWEEINISLKYLAEKKLELKKLETEQEEKINEIKKENSLKIELLKEGIASAEESIKTFAEANISDFGEKRSKKFTFGKISLKSSKSFVIGCVETTIKRLRALNLNNCIREKEEIIKESLKKLDKPTLSKVGISVVMEDKISIEAG